MNTTTAIVIVIIVGMLIVAFSPDPYRNKIVKKKIVVKKDIKKYSKQKQLSIIHEDQLN